MLRIFTKIKKLHLFCLGMAILVLSQIPQILLGTDAIVPYHDQLDGEIIAYIYQAKYLFSGTDLIPEFLNGVSKTALTPPAPLAVLLFCVLPPFAAYMVLQILGQVVAYIGMFLLADRFVKNTYVVFVSAMFYAFLPFLPVYGLAQYGVPLLLFSFLQLYEKRNSVIASLYVVFYAGMSSLVLIGFLWVLAGGFVILWFLCKKILHKKKALVYALVGMDAMYILENLSLFQNLLGGGRTSHKAEYVIYAGEVLPGFWSYLTGEISHVYDFHPTVAILVAVTLILTISTWKNRTDTERNIFKILCIDLIPILLLCFIGALWKAPFVVSFREKFGALGSFQFDRILWATSAFWYLALALSLYLLWGGKGVIKWTSRIFSVILLAVLGFSCLKASFVKPCVQELILPEYETISWSDYFALGVMEQVEAFLYEKEGKKIDEYKVASLGIDPVAALYHGFYCVDGYSNNYPLEYKHAFRRVIAKELSKSDYLTNYYDNWGNRCYLYAAEIPAYFNIEKGTAYYQQLELDTKELKQLGCDYIFSAAYIIPAEKMDLTLLREEAFETEESYYRIYVYKLPE